MITLLRIIHIVAFTIAIGGAAGIILFVLYAGFVGIASHFGVGWAIAALFSTIMVIGLPFVIIGAFLAMVDVWGWSLGWSIIFASSVPLFWMPLGIFGSIAILADKKIRELEMEAERRRDDGNGEKEEAGRQNNGGDSESRRFLPKQKNRMKKLTFLIPLFAILFAVSHISFTDECLLCDPAFNGDIAEVKRLLDGGANLDAGNDHGNTALMVAVGKGYAEIVKMLISAGANVDAANDGDATALHVAANKGNAEFAKILLSAGANPNATDNKGVTSLMVAAFDGHDEVAKMLLSAGANPNAVGMESVTALIAAVSKGHAEVVKILIAGGAEVNQRTSEGNTALDMAKFRRFSEIERILRAAGAKE